MQEEAAGLQGKFWEMHDMLYDKQAEWSTGINARDIIMNYASVLKLDTKKFADDLNSKAIEEKILAELKEGTALDVQGTPTFFLNGKKIDNPSSLEAFDKLIREAAAK
jgi:protein-disulfide isomerase